MLVKTEQEEGLGLMSENEITDIETQIFQNELFGSSLETPQEDMLQNMDPLQQGDYMSDLWGGSSTSPSSSTRSSSASSDMVHFLDELNDLVNSNPVNSYPECFSSQPDTLLASTELTAPVKQEAGLFQQVIEGMNSTNNLPQFKIVETEVDSSSNRPVVNVVCPTQQISPIPLSVDFTETSIFKSSPPQSPQTPPFITSPTLSNPTTLPTILPQYKVLTVSSPKNDLLKLSPHSSTITKTKKIQPKMMLSRVGPVEPIMTLQKNNPSIQTQSPNNLPTGGGVTSLLERNAGPINNCFSQQAKINKRHERMIKNRESASLSRKKKKEYVTTLESELMSVKEENSKLKEENESLKSKLKQFAEECNSLRQRLTGSKGGKAPMFNVKTASTLFLSVMCLMSVKILNNHNPSSNMEGPLSSPDLTDQSSNDVQSMPSRHLLWEDYDFTDNTTFIFNSSICSSFLNETETMQLETVLRHWFDNKKGHPWQLAALSEGNYHKSVLSNRKLKSLQGKSDKSRRGNASRIRASKVNRALATTKPERSTMMYRDYLYRSPPLTIEPSMGSSVETGLIEGHARPPSLLEVLQKTPDTYYVVSLSKDLLLCPAEVHNSSSRPKISILLPTQGNSTSDNQLSLMRIDCEVVQTSNLSVAAPVKEEKSYKYGNESAQYDDGALLKDTPQVPASKTLKDSLNERHSNRLKSDRQKKLDKFDLAP